MTTIEPAISVTGLSKRYGDIEAVCGIDFEVARGETFGFLGPNGAGKSTTINMLCTLARPTGGSARVAGFDVVAERDRVRRNIGLVFQDTTLDNYLTAEQNLRLHAELYGMPRETIAPRMKTVLEMLQLWERRDSLVGTFSGGMKRRLEIARGLLHSPRVLFLDEPTIAALRERFGIEAQMAEGVVTFGVAEGEQFVPRLFDEWDPAHPPIRSVSVARPSLDDVFMSYTGSTIRDAEAGSTDMMRNMARMMSR